MDTASLCDLCDVCVCVTNTVEAKRLYICPDQLNIFHKCIDDVCGIRSRSCSLLFLWCCTFTDGTSNGPEQFASQVNCPLIEYLATGLATGLNSLHHTLIVPWLNFEELDSRHDLE